MKNVIKAIKKFESELTKNKLIIKEKFEFKDQLSESSLIKIQRELQRIEPSILDFYELANVLEIKWEATDLEKLKEEMTGRVMINPFSQVVKDWNGVVFFDSEPTDSAIRKFFPIDFFADEAASGFCTKEGWRNMIYLYQFEGDLVPLQVNFESYLKLMLLAKGCFYWQYFIIELLQKKENEVSGRIKKNLPDIFTDFSFSTFENLFNELRIN